MKRLMMAFGVAGLVAASAAGGASAAEVYSGVGQPSANANCMGVERAALNSKGGSREHGGLGEVQPAWVQGETVDASGNYGQWIQNGWNSKPANCK